MHVCPHCGEPLTLGAKFCGKCGLRADQVETTPIASRSIEKASSVFAGTEFIVEKRIAAVLSTFEIKDVNGTLVATGRKEAVPLGPAYVVETAEGARIGELRGALALIPNRPSHS